MPWAAISPSSSRATRSARLTVDGRCATTSAVVPARTVRSALVTFASVCTSSADSGSSRISTGGRARMARARATRWRCPPDSVMPCSPIRVSSPHGRSRTKPAWAAASAASIASSSASGAPKPTFSRTLAENRVGSSNAQLTRARSSGSGRLRMSVPSSRMAPEVTSASRGTNWSRVVFPEPVAPTSTTVWPGATSSETLRSTARCSPG